MEGGNMQIGHAVRTLEYIAKNIEGWDRPARLGVFGAFGEIDRELRAVVEKHQLGSKTFEELRRYRWSLATLCGLSPGNGHDEAQHRSWMLGAVWGLEADMCLGTVLDEPE